MGKKDDELRAEVDGLVKRMEENAAMAIQIRNDIIKILKSGWFDGAPILSEKRKELERDLEMMGALVGDEDFADENDHIH